MSFWQMQLTKWIDLACRMEVMCAKPGNVCPGHDFADAGVSDFLRSAALASAPMASACEQPLGRSIRNAVSATRSQVSHNTNLGIILLITPLAAVPPQDSLAEGIHSVLDKLTIDDSHDVYEAIRIACPGGLGTTDSQDIRQPPTMNLRECMRLSADIDLIARQYVNGFEQVLCDGPDLLREARRLIDNQPQRITWVALKLLSRYGDSLIRRKCGEDMSSHVKRLAGEVLLCGWPMETAAHARYAEFDSFLRADGHRRNPGTTADLIAAILFSGLREGWISPDGDWWVSGDYE
ncbi:MAG: triphosphoribosyl-dephospho-CoA synthase [Planctomyces sp.]|nr:triphosphoribosyl-dephospho-CoA synthase [Planctomyces sp.]